MNQNDKISAMYTMFFFSSRILQSQSLCFNKNMYTPIGQICWTQRIISQKLSSCHPVNKECWKKSFTASFEHVTRNQCTMVLKKCYGFSIVNFTNYLLLRPYEKKILPSCEVNGFRWPFLPQFFLYINFTRTISGMKPNFAGFWWTKKKVSVPLSRTPVWKITDWNNHVGKTTLSCRKNPYAPGTRPYFPANFPHTHLTHDVGRRQEMCID